jgi:hypothetical protein
MSEFATDVPRETGYRPPVEAPPEPPIIYVPDVPITPEEDTAADETREAADNDHDITASEEDDTQVKAESTAHEVPEISPEADDDDEPVQPQKPQETKAEEKQPGGGTYTDQPKAESADDAKPQAEPQPESKPESEAQPQPEPEPQPEPQPQREAEEAQEPQREYAYASEPPPRPPRRGTVYADRRVYSGDRLNPLFRADHPDNERQLGEVSADAGRVSREEVEKIRSAAEQAGDYRPPKPEEPEAVVPEPEKTEAKPAAETKEPEAKPEWASERTRELPTVPAADAAADKPDPEKLLGAVFGDKSDVTSGEVVDAELGEVVNGKWVPADQQLPGGDRPWERWDDPRQAAAAGAEVAGAGRTRGSGEAAVEQIAMDGLGEAARAASQAAAAIPETPVTTQWQNPVNQPAQEANTGATAGYEAPTTADSVTGGERDEGAAATVGAGPAAAASGSNSPGTGTATGRASVNPNARQSGQNTQPSAAAAPSPDAANAPHQAPDTTKPAETPPAVKKRDPIIRPSVPKEVVRSRAARVARATARLAAKAAIGAAGAVATPIEASRKITVGQAVKLADKRGTYSVRIIRNGRPAIIEVKPRINPLKLMRMNTAQREAARVAAARQMVNRRRIRNTWRTM